MNTKIQHTPGPWSMSRDAVPPGHVQITVYAEASGQRVATAFEQEANARLIAAAPDLLAACKDLNGYLNAVANQLPVSELSAVLEKVKHSADTIARAEGKEAA